MDNYNTNLTAEEPDANVNELPVHNTMQSGDRLLGSGTAEEFLVDYELLADAILNKLTTKEYAGLGTAAKNIPAAIKELAQGKIPVTFTKATTRSEIASTEKLPTLFGKISKWLSDLGAAAFCKVANNDTTTAEGYVADARAVEKLGKELDAVNSSFNFKNVQGQIGKNGSINCFANIYMKTFPGRKCDIHIQFRIDMQNPTTENWPVFDMAALCGLLQIKSLSFPYGIIRPIGHEIPQLEDVRCGFQLAESGQVGRYYKYESTGQEGWGAYSVKSLFENKFLVLNHYYEIDIYGATYS